MSRLIVEVNLPLQERSHLEKMAKSQLVSMRFPTPELLENSAARVNNIIFDASGRYQIQSVALDLCQLRGGDAPMVDALRVSIESVGLDIGDGNEYIRVDLSKKVKGPYDSLYVGSNPQFFLVWTSTTYENTSLLDFGEMDVIAPDGILLIGSEQRVLIRQDSMETALRITWNPIEIANAIADSKRLELLS